MKLHEVLDRTSILLSMAQKLVDKGELWLQTSDGGAQLVIGLGFKNDSARTKKFVEVKLEPKTVQGVGVGGTRWLHMDNLKNYEIVKREGGGHLLQLKPTVDPEFKANALKAVGESLDTGDITLSMLKKLLAGKKRVWHAEFSKFLQLKKIEELQNDLEITDSSGRMTMSIADFKRFYRLKSIKHDGEERWVLYDTRTNTFESLDPNEVLLSMLRKLHEQGKLLVRYNGFNYPVGSIEIERSGDIDWVTVTNDNNIIMFNDARLDKLAKWYGIKKAGDKFVLYDKIDGEP